MIKSVNRYAQTQSRQRQKPAALPNGRQNRERHKSRLGGRDAVRIDGADEKKIIAGRNVRIIDGALRHRFAPIRVSAFEFELITDIFAESEVDTEKIYLQIVLCVIEFERMNFRLSQFGKGLFDSGDTQSADQNWRRVRHSLRLRLQAR